MCCCSTCSRPAGSSDSILDAVARLESQIEETEAELEIQASVTGEATASPSLERKLNELDRQAQIEQRLARLKEEVSRGQNVGA